MTFALRKIPQFHPISWRGNFVEKHSGKTQAIRPKLCGNCAFPQNFHTRKLGEITVLLTMVKYLQFSQMLEFLALHHNQ